MPRTRQLLAGLVLFGLAACDGADAPVEEPEPEPVVLGPVDGRDLPPTDLERVAAGDLAPDFSAEALGGEVHTLSDYRGEKNVVLFFYRGHW